MPPTATATTAAAAAAAAHAAACGCPRSQAIEVGPCTDRAGPCLVHFKGCSLTPGELNAWLVNGPASCNVVRTPGRGSATRAGWPVLFTSANGSCVQTPHIACTSHPPPGPRVLAGARPSGSALTRGAGGGAGGGRAARRRPAAPAVLPSLPGAAARG